MSQNGKRTVVAVVAVLLTLPLLAFGQHYSEWSAPVKLAAEINSPDGESEPFLSRDGLSLYFSSDRPGGYGGTDIYVSHRANRQAPWGVAVNLGPVINTPESEGYPTLSNDGHRLYVRYGPPSDTNIFVSWRRDTDDDFGWETPVNLGTPLNSNVNDACLSFFEDENSGLTFAYFQSSRTVGISMRPDIYATVLNEDGAFMVPLLVSDLSTPFNDRGPSVRRDGLEIYFDSNRPGGVGGPGGNDIWVATRTSTVDPWTGLRSVPMVNQLGYQGRPALSFDATEMYFYYAEMKPGVPPNFDLYVSTRTKLTGCENNGRQCGP